MNLQASKQITESVKVVASINEIQVWKFDRIEYVWFCNNIDQARERWVYAVDAARRLADRIAA
jgi:hypothetical protein